MGRIRLSADELARLAEAEPAFVERAIQAGALQQRETAGGFGIQDAARLRFLEAWDTAGLKVEVIGDLIARGELPFAFMDAPTMGAQPRLPSTYAEFCTQRGIDLSLAQRLHDALGFTPPAASDHVREDDLIVVDLLQQWLAVGAEEAAALRLLRTYADALRRLTQAEADLYEAQIEEPQRQGGAPARLARPLHRPPGAHPGGQGPVPAPGGAAVRVLCGPDRLHRRRHLRLHGQPRRPPVGPRRPGGVLVSRPAADRLPQPSGLEPVGAVQLKGVAQPLQVWRWSR